MARSTEPRSKLLKSGTSHEALFGCGFAALYGYWATMPALVSNENPVTLSQTG